MISSKLLPAMAALVLLPLSSCGDSGTTEKPSNTTLLSAYVRPSISYIEVAWKATVYDPNYSSYITVSQKNDAVKVFEIGKRCSGFVVNPDGYVATSGHCVDPKEVAEDFKTMAAEWALDTGYFDASEVTAESLVENAGFQIETADLNSERENADRGAIDVYLGEGDDVEQSRARLVSYRSLAKGDTALLKVDEADLLAVKLAKTSALEVGTEVVSVGYPAKVDLAVDDDFNPSYKDGEISSKKTVEEGLFTVYEVSSAISGGMSGGPTANLNGAVVGFNSFGPVDEDGESEQFNFIGTSDLLIELMNDAGVKNDIGPVSRDYKTGLDAYFDGDKETAVEKLQAVIDEGSKSETAENYLAKAKKLPDPFPLALVIGIAAGVIALAVVVLLLLRRKGGKAGGPENAPEGPGATTATTPSPDGEAMTPQPAGTSTMVIDAGEPDQRPSGFQTAPSAGPKAETQDLADQHPGGLFCSSCGTRHETGAKYCPSCGAAL